MTVNTLVTKEEMDIAMWDAHYFARNKDWHSRCENVLSYTFNGLHNVPGNVKYKNADGEWPSVEVCVSGGLSSYDFDRLTRLVMAAHRYLVRVDVSAASSRYIRITLTPRLASRPGLSMFDKHPSLADLREYIT